MIAILPFYEVLRSHFGDHPTGVPKNELKRLRKDMESRIKNDMDAWALLASSEVFLDREKDALSTLNSALGIDSDFYLGWHMMSSLYVGPGVYEEAERFAKKASSGKIDNKVLRKHLRSRISR